MGVVTRAGSAMMRGWLADWLSTALPATECQRLGGVYARCRRAPRCIQRHTAVPDLPRLGLDGGVSVRSCDCCHGSSGRTGLYRMGKERDVPRGTSPRIECCVGSDIVAQAQCSTWNIAIWRSCLQVAHCWHDNYNLLHLTKLSILLMHCSTWNIAFIGSVGRGVPRGTTHQIARME